MWRCLCLLTSPEVRYACQCHFAMAIADDKEAVYHPSCGEGDYDNSVSLRAAFQLLSCIGYDAGIRVSVIFVLHQQTSSLSVLLKLGGFPYFPALRAICWS